MTERILRDLGDGLILCRGTEQDIERLVAFNGEVHRDPSAAEPEASTMAWTRDLMNRSHPTTGPGDFTLVEDTRSGALVSTLCTISQTWSFDGIPFGVGRPELVATHPDYRRRGLIRAQMEVVHGWSAERGEQVQAITGIPWYYRQFGYEMAMALGGSRVGYKPNLPKLKEGEEELYRIRPATESDLPFIGQVYDHGIRRYPVACLWDGALWRHELLGKNPASVFRRHLCLIETAAGGPAAGEPVGFLLHATRLWQGGLSASWYELKPGVSWLAVTPVVARYLWTRGETLAAGDPKGEMDRFSFSLGAEHPAYEVLDRGLPHAVEPYAWYLRVADLPGFVRHIAPALEARLVASPLVGHSGEICISFYRRGLRLVLEGGRLCQVESWQPGPGQQAGAAFPDLTFLQLLFGNRSLDELDRAFADCWTSGDEARALLNALFPKRLSNVLPVS